MKISIEFDIKEPSRWTQADLIRFAEAVRVPGYDDVQISKMIIGPLRGYDKLPEGGKA